MKRFSLFKTVVSLAIAISANTNVSQAQCPTLSCPGNFNVSADSGKCGAVITYQDPGPIDTLLFSYTGTVQKFVVPSNTSSLTIKAYGSQGGSNASGVKGGLGGYAQGDVSVTPGDTLYIYVGGTNGYNGGGAAGNQPCSSAVAGIGGGASDVRIGGQSLTNRVIVAGGGGGAGGNRITGCGRGSGGGGGGGYYGGGGGAAWPHTSSNLPTGGTQSAGGAGGTSDWTNTPNNNGTNGVLGIGGNGGAEISSSQSGSGTALAGGTGGGATGGSGSYSVNWTGQSGAGGSSYLGSLSSSNTIAGINSGNGQVVIKFNTTSSSIVNKLIEGLPSGSEFGPGVTTNKIMTICSGTDTSYCTFTVTVAGSPLKDTVNVTTYDDYVSPSGKVFTSTGTYQDTVLSSGGCDSIITIHLTTAERIYVDGGMSSSGNGSAWGQAFSTLQEAIDSANTHNEPTLILVKEGTYYPTGNGRNSTFMLTNINTRILGGFSGAETHINQRNATANKTILCGDIGTKGDSSDNVYHVLIILDKRTYSSGEEVLGSDFVIDGFTIKDGNANGSSTFSYEGEKLYQSEGGGILIYGKGAGREISPTISNCHFENNYGDYGTIFIEVKNGKSNALITNNTFKGNRSFYGAIFNNGESGDVSPRITNCAFVNNFGSTSGSAIYNYGYSGKSSPVIDNCVFSGNRTNLHGGAIYNNGYGGASNPTITNCTFYGNEAKAQGGVMYNFGASGGCSPKVTNSILYNNAANGDVDHKFSELYSYQAYPYVSYSSMQRDSNTYTTATANSLNWGSNNLYKQAPQFESTTDLAGADDVWRSGDDGLRLKSSSAQINSGTATGATSSDILDNQRAGSVDLGSYEYVSCGLNVKLATAVKTHVATKTATDNGFTCYCNSDNELLLALDTNGSGAVITPNQVKLYIGDPSTLSYNSAGGMITNTAGGVILERRWDVDPTTQPTGTVRVRYYYTKSNYEDIVTAMAGLTSPTTVLSPSQLQFYKVTGGSSATFPNPHDNGVTGIILSNSTTASTTTWVSGTHGVQDHSAEYLVTSFSGGGGGGGGGAEPLPVELISFNVKKDINHSAILKWETASELNNSHFIIERSYSGQEFTPIATVQGNGTTQQLIAYDFNDKTIDKNENTAFYRLKQVDFDGTFDYSIIKKVTFDELNKIKLATLNPNPTDGNIKINLFNDELDVHTIKVIDQLGRTIKTIEFSGETQEISLSELTSGIYFVTLDDSQTFKVIKK